MTALSEYRRKRDFSLTPEPRAEIGKAGGQLSFVVQKHAARRLHYDFRLEHGGVLWSWAVTRGPSADPAEKRLAVRTEDHPVAYGSFEGTIPAGEYGGGTVMLWDRGWWEPLHDPEAGLAEGKLHFRLHGARMKGGWALVRLRGQERRENWLLIKERDEHVGRGDGLVRRHARSVTTGRTMAAIAAGRPAETPQAEREAPAPAAHGKPRPRFRPVQLATLATAPPEGEGWRHEAKFDGYRCLIALGKGGVRLHSRSGLDWTGRFGALAAPAAAIPCASALIDGEVVAGEGGGDFSTLQKALDSGGALVFYAFDCLHLDGRDLAGQPLTARRAALERLIAPLPPRGPVRLSPFIAGAGAEVLDAICRAGGEGIVSKRADAPYRGGRGTAWIKTKCGRRAEFVIIGHSPSDRPGRPFASLLLGSYEKGRLVYRGRVGTGFGADDFATLAAAMKPLRRPAPEGIEGLDATTRGARWVRPELVAEISYAEFTGEGRIRHGVYHGLRADKEAFTVAAQAEIDAEALTLRGVRISSPGRVVFPGTDITKGDVARHYDLVAERLLSRASGHPVSLLRCPAGIAGECFFQKHAGKGFPAAIPTIPIEESDGSVEDYMYLSNPASILAAVQMGTVEFHLWGSARDRLERPARLVFDLDPDPAVGFPEVRKAAAELRTALEGMGLSAGAMVTGGKGVHVIVPLRRSAEWPVVKGFAQTFAQAMAERHPGRFVATMSKARRKGRIFIDWLRNDRGATAIAPYALRARPGAPVAVPVGWDELASLAAANTFGIADMAARLAAPCPLAGLPARSIGAGIIAALEAWAVRRDRRGRAEQRPGGEG